MKWLLCLLLSSSALFSVQPPAINPKTLYGLALFRAKNVQLVLQAMQGNEELVKAVLALPGVDVNFADTKGKSALHYAAERGYANVVSLLLAAHADRRLLDKQGKSAEQLAQESGFSQISSLMPRFGLYEAAHIA